MPNNNNKNYTVEKIVKNYERLKRGTSVRKHCWQIEFSSL